ncbi:hypothetical protein [Parvicella tangerina]|uniref:Uncharacterized protein n=1 Tax=Parvicella tangerina TaxID=2829795 RepID=A0A916NH77_9FLAO|nr:hypothetical protein [Parvicella tangerina]CAG5080942.1 hypothetical protein CRYO30217_01490 [Parvicella tangerina]
MELEGSYIQYAAGYDKDNISKSDIEKALNDLTEMDDEHGAFWIGIYGADTEEFVIEFHKSLTLFGNFGEEENYKIKLDEIESAKEFFFLLLNGEIDELREKLKNN